MRAPADPGKHTATIVILLLLLAGGYVFRTVFSTAVMPPPARMQGETTQAYRYAGMVSSGQGIPEVDSLVMRPGGMVTGENSIFEEYLAGGIHRVTGGNFDSFLRLFSMLFPLLTMPVLFFWMKGTGFSRIESLTGTTLYAVFLPALLRTRGESLYRETVALPLLFTALMLADVSRIRKGRDALIPAIAGAALFFFALAAWKVTAFLAFLLFVWLVFSRAGKFTVLPFAIVQILASLTLSHMIHDGSITSPATFMAGVSIVASLTGKHKAAGIAGLALSVLAAVLFSSSATGHVASVTGAKLRFFFTHPENPALLSDDARLFWVSGYTSPSPGQALLLFGLAGVLALAGWKRFIRISRGTLLFWLAPVSAAGYLFFDRLHVILAAGIIPPLISALRGNRYLLCSIVLLFGVHAMFAPETAQLLSGTGLEFQQSGSLLGDSELNGLLEWAREHEGTYLSFWHISGLLSAYAETPVVTHTFFENSGNRNTIVQFAEKIYGTEAEMASFMEEKGAEYLVYQADFVFDRSPQGLLYLAGLTTVPDGSLAVRMHYYPESLERFAAVWQGPSLRIFALDGDADQTLDRYVLWDREYGSFLNDYEMALASVMSPVETGLYLANVGMESGDPRKISAALLLLAGSSEEVPGDASIELLQRLLMAYLQDGYDLESLTLDFESYLEAWGPDPQLRLDLIRLLQSGGMNERAEYHLEILENSGRQGS